MVQVFCTTVAGQLPYPSSTKFGKPENPNRVGWEGVFGRGAPAWRHVKSQHVYDLYVICIAYYFLCVYGFLIFVLIYIYTHIVFHFYWRLHVLICINRM